MSSVRSTENWPWIATAVDRRGERLTASGQTETDAVRALVEAGARLGTIATYRVPPYQGEDL